MRRTAVAWQLAVLPESRNPEPLVSPYLRLPIRPLRKVCEDAGRYGAGEHCPTCPLRDFCTGNLRRHERDLIAGVRAGVTG